MRDRSATSRRVSRASTQSRVGDTVTLDRRGAEEPLPGYRPAKPMVFAGIYPTDPNEYEELRAAFERLSLNDASLVWQPESSAALGFGFRAGFLGLLHMEIVQERLEREFSLDLVATAPSVEYEVTRSDGREIVVDSPAQLPPPNETSEVREPWVRLAITVPSRYLGAVMELVTGRRGRHLRLEYLDHGVAEGDARVLAEFLCPLAEILVDFYDQLKSRTQGYASLDYQIEGFEPAKVLRLDILVNGEPVDALSTIVQSQGAAAKGRQLTAALKELIPRQLFAVPIQAAVGGRIVARETVRAMRKNVLAKCYGGDVTRKRKLLERQKGGQEAHEDARRRRGPAGGVHGGAQAAGVSAGACIMLSALSECCHAGTDHDPQRLRGSPRRAEGACRAPAPNRCRSTCLVNWSGSPRCPL